MKIYEVGGCVRDRLMGRKPKDIDYVVIGSTPEEMIAIGFEQVGADFPVFLHSVTRHEYALARTERKSGRGYHGFTVDASPEVTLDEDLRRRDLTINSMARDPETDEIIDPFNGRRDLEARILRHTSDAFAEDPVRVLRVARFAARYNFNIAPETRALMKQLADSGELDTLTNERVFSEWDKAMREPFAAQFLFALADGPWERLFPELKNFDINVLTRASLIPNVFEPAEITAMMLRSQKARVQGFELFERLRAPNHYLKMIQLVSNLAFNIEGYHDMTSRLTLDTLLEVGAYKDSEQFFRVVRCVDFMLEHEHERKLLYWLVEAFHISRYISFAHLTSDARMTLKAKEIGAAIDALRWKTIKDYKI